MEFRNNHLENLFSINKIKKIVEYTKSDSGRRKWTTFSLYYKPITLDI